MNIKITNKIIFLFIGILLVNFVSATDVAYIAINDLTVKSEFTDALDRLSLTWEVIPSNDVSTYNFSDYKLILLDDEYFPNWQDIPVNDVPSLIVNGRNIENWGWTTRVTTASQSQPITVDLITAHEIKGNLLFNVPVYTTTPPDIYYLDKDDVYDGLEIIAANTYDNEDAVIAITHKGTNLTRGTSVTEINAKGVFFGIYETGYWTNETKQLFENSLLWLTGESSFDIEIKQGLNLISFPLIINFNLSEILSENSEINSIKEYNSGVVDVTEITNSKGYFIEASSDFSLTITGSDPGQGQSVLLNQGMNLIGINSLSNMSLNNLPSGIIEVAKRNQDGSHDISTKYNSNWFNSFELEPGEGYWFKIETGGVVWNYNP